jgi:hypothetical protein
MQAEDVAAAKQAVAGAKVDPLAIGEIPSLPPPEEHVLTLATMSLTMDPTEQQIKWPQPGSKLIFMLAQSLVRKSPTPCKTTHHGYGSMKEP